MAGGFFLSILGLPSFSQRKLLNNFPELAIIRIDFDFLSLGGFLTFCNISFEASAFHCGLFLLMMMFVLLFKSNSFINQ